MEDLAEKFTLCDVDEMEASWKSDSNFGRFPGEAPETLYLEDEFVDITPNKDGGVVKRVMKEGVGAAKPDYGDHVKVQYKYFIIQSWESREIFKHADYETFHFNVGRSSMAKGLEVGLFSMKKGEISHFICKQPYAFLGQYPNLPSCTSVMYEAKLLYFCKEDLTDKKDQGIIRKNLVKPRGRLYPNSNASVKVHITGYYDNKIFDDREVTFIIGEGCILDIPRGIETALTKFRPGETSRLSIASKYAFGPDGKREKGIPPEADVVYDITLIEFQRGKEIWDLNPDEKRKYSIEAREKGIAFYNNGYLKPALSKFKKIIRYLEDEPGAPPEEKESRQQLLLTGYLNASLVYIKLMRPLRVIKMCTKALEIDPVNEKALFRRGQAYFKVKEYSEALSDYEKLISLYPNNLAARGYIPSCKVQVQLQEMKDRLVYANMFQQFVPDDEAWWKLHQHNTETGVWGGQMPDKETFHYQIAAYEEEIVEMLNKHNLYMTDKGSDDDDDYDDDECM